MKVVGQWAPIRVSVQFTPGETSNGPVFTADRPMILEEAIEVHSVVGAASSLYQVAKCEPGESVFTGDAILETSFPLDSTVNVPIFRNEANGGFVADEGVRQFNRGDSVCGAFFGTVTNYEGCVTFIFRPLPPTASPY